MARVNLWLHLPHRLQASPARTLLTGQTSRIRQLRGYHILGQLGPSTTLLLPMTTNSSQFNTEPLPHTESTALLSTKSFSIKMLSQYAAVCHSLSVLSTFSTVLIKMVKRKKKNQGYNKSSVNTKTRVQLTALLLTMPHHAAPNPSMGARVCKCPQSPPHLTLPIFCVEGLRPPPAHPKCLK